MIIYICLSIKNSKLNQNMKKLPSLIIALSFCSVGFCQNWKTLLTKDVKPEGLSSTGKIVFQFDTASTRSRARFIYTGKDAAGADIKKECADSSFESKYSSKEFKSILQALITGCMNDGLVDTNPDKKVIVNKLPVILEYAAPEWYTDIQGKLTAKKENKVQSNVGDLSYNDSLMATLIPSCLLRTYKEEKRNDSLVNTRAPDIPLKSIKVQVSDGFIYSFSFDIDTSRLDPDMKQELRPHQSFSLRYNLRHNILSKGLMDDRDAVYLKKIHTSLKNSNSQYVFYAGELFDYQSPLAAVNTIFTARDTIITINYKDCIANVNADSVKLREKSLYSIINLDVFGDLVGFFDNNKPNGLIQTELKANFYGFRKPWSQKKTTRARFTLFNKGELFFRLSKLDDKNRFLPVLTDTLRRAPQNDTVVKYVHGYRLLEYQNIYSGLRFNVGEVEFRGGSLAFTGELTFLRTPLNDTVFVTVEKQGRIDTVLSPVDFGKNSLIIAPGIDLKIFAASFCDIDLRGRLFFIHPLTKKIRTTRTEFDDFYGANTYKDIITTKLYNLGMQFTLNLNNEKSRRIIFRGDAYIDTHTRGNNFVQLQLGYSADLNKFISFNNPAKN